MKPAWEIANGKEQPGSPSSPSGEPTLVNVPVGTTRMVRLVHKARTLFIVVIPWVIIGSLVYIAFFIKPGSLIQSPPVPPVAHGDRFYGVASPDASTFWAVGSFGKIIKSPNAGESWVIQPSPVHSSLQSVVAWNKQDALAVGDNSIIIRTSDGGAHWSEVHDVPQASSEFNKLIKATISPTGDVWVVGEQATVLVSRDKGSTWTRVAPVQDITFNGIAINAGTVWVVGEFGTILVSHDGGATWLPQSSGTESTLTAITFNDATTGVAVGLDGTILVTADGGEHWAPAAMPPTQTQFYAVAHSKNAWLVSGDNGMFATVSLPSQKWDLHTLGKSDFSWHVAALSMAKGQKWLVVGSDVRILEAGHWNEVKPDNGAHP